MACCVDMAAARLGHWALRAASGSSWARWLEREGWPSSVGRGSGLLASRTRAMARRRAGPMRSSAPRSQLGARATPPEAGPARRLRLGAGAELGRLDHVISLIAGATKRAALPRAGRRTKLGMTPTRSARSWRRRRRAEGFGHRPARSRTATPLDGSTRVESTRTAGEADEASRSRKQRREHDLGHRARDALGGPDPLQRGLEVLGVLAPSRAAARWPRRPRCAPTPRRPRPPPRA